VLDEVQTGVGRTGSWFAFQRYGIEPDVVTLAKALAGGLPIGACISRSELAFGPGEHASTFGGGPVPCAAALAVLDTIEAEGLLENCLLRGKELIGGLAESGAAGLREVRGMGLLIGAAFEDDRAGAVVRALMARGFLATEAGPSVVRFAPPLTVTGEEVAKLVRAFEAAARDAAEVLVAKEEAS
jgi:acetylornithine aminotransferase